MAGDITTTALSVAAVEVLLPQMLERYGLEMTGPEGQPGLDGTGIDEVRIVKGELVVSLDDGRDLNLGRVVGPIGAMGARGPRGQRGPRGHNIVKAEIDGAGSLVLELGDEAKTRFLAGRVVGATGPAGPAGREGAEGARGPRGHTFNKAEIDGDGNLALELGNPERTRFLAGRVVGDRGRAGATGATGPQGPAGEPGAHGRGVDSIAYDHRGIVFTLTDGTELQVAMPDAPPGPAGPAGVSVVDAEITKAGNLAIKLSDGARHDLGKVVGPEGKPGDSIDALSINPAGDLLVTYRRSGVSRVVNLGRARGIDGISIEDAEISDDGDLLVKFDTGTVKNVGKVVARDGRNGKDGDAVLKAEVVDGKLFLHIRRPGQGIDIQELGQVRGADGKDGAKGRRGPNGAHGRGVDRAVVNESGDLILDYSDGIRVSAGRVRGERGDDGVGIRRIAYNAAADEIVFRTTDGKATKFQGIRGPQGSAGPRGRDGNDGMAGAPGAPGRAGYGFALRGKWLPGQTYYGQHDPDNPDPRQADVVARNGALYVCLARTGAEPPGESWLPLGPATTLRPAVVAMNAPPLAPVVHPGIVSPRKQQDPSFALKLAVDDRGHPQRGTSCIERPGQPKPLRIKLSLAEGSDGANQSRICQLRWNGQTIPSPRPLSDRQWRFGTPGPVDEVSLVDAEIAGPDGRFHFLQATLQVFDRVWWGASANTAVVQPDDLLHTTIAADWPSQMRVLGMPERYLWIIAPLTWGVPTNWSRIALKWKEEATLPVRNQAGAEVMCRLFRTERHFDGAILLEPRKEAPK